jgi:hypothetical protein
MYPYIHMEEVTAPSWLLVNAQSMWHILGWVPRASLSTVSLSGLTGIAPSMA